MSATYYPDLDEWVDDDDDSHPRNSHQKKRNRVKPLS